MTKSNKHIGSSFDDFLEETGDEAEVTAIAIKRVLAWELQQKMDNEHISHSAMAAQLSTSRSSLSRLLDPENTSITLTSLVNTAKVIGKPLKFELG